MSKTVNFYKRFLAETMYFWNDEVECYVKVDPDIGSFIKFKGKLEAPINSDSKTVIGAVSPGFEVTKKEYEEA